MSFCQMLGLKINLDKSTLMRLNCEEEDVVDLVGEIGCGRDS